MRTNFSRQIALADRPTAMVGLDCFAEAESEIPAPRDGYADGEPAAQLRGDHLGKLVVRVSS